MKDGRGLMPESRQIVPPPGHYQALLRGNDGEERETVVEIGENSLSWPLADGENIRYIVMKDRR